MVGFAWAQLQERQNTLMQLMVGGWDYGDLSYPMEERTFCWYTLSEFLSIAAADAVLTKLLEKGPEFQEGLNYTCEHMCEEINRIFTINHVPLKTYHYGSLFRFEPIKSYHPLIRIYLLTISATKE